MMMNNPFARRVTRFTVLALFVSLATASTVRAADEPCNYPPKSAIGADGWINLFDGKDLKGWKLSDTATSKVHVEDGKIVMGGPTSHLFTDWQFKNFIFEAEVMTTPGSNSGIYFHTHYQEHGFPKTGYESQVNVSHRDPVKTGSLYHIVKLYKTPAKDNKWWKQTIIVEGKHVIVKIDDEQVIDYVEPADTSHQQEKIGCGSFALQSHDPKSVTYFKNIRVKPLPETAATADTSNKNEKPAAKQKTARRAAVQ
jgi:3-keto-disaccharide hydrolase